MLAAISAIRLISADAGTLAQFYVDAFGFVRQTDGRPRDVFCGGLRRLAVLSLGGQRLEIAEPAKPAAAAATASQPATSFQHFALVAPDMARAFSRLHRRQGWRAISRDGPQALPPSSGGVTAFKFRDPEGHPLELLAFPAAATPAHWRGRKGDIVGIDHTAIAVAETARSLAFYGALGFRQAAATLNHGPEQAALDGITGAEVEVTALALAEAAPPHLELLCYRQTHADARADDDLLATRTIMAAGDTALRDPDGHRWIVPASALTSGRSPLEPGR